LNSPGLAFTIATIQEAINEAIKLDKPVDIPRVSELVTAIDELNKTIEDTEHDLRAFVK
jgi:hypothetical protein